MDLKLPFSIYDKVLALLPAWIVAYIPKLVLEKLRPLATQWQADGEKWANEQLEPILAPLKPFFKLCTDLKGSTIGLFTKVEKFATTCKEEYEAIIHFKEDLHWRGRVVNAPQVVKKVKHLAKIPGEIAKAVKEMVATIKAQTGVESPVKSAEEAANALQGIEDFRGFFTKFAPKLLKGAEKLLGVLAILVECVVAWNKTIDDLQLIIDDIKEIRLDIEKLDLIFLPQNHKRRFVQLEDGRTTRWRIGGHLHPT